MWERKKKARARDSQRGCSVLLVGGGLAHEGRAERVCVIGQAVDIALCQARDEEAIKLGLEHDQAVRGVLDVHFGVCQRVDEALCIVVGNGVRDGIDVLGGRLQLAVEVLRRGVDTQRGEVVEVVGLELVVEVSHGSVDGADVGLDSGNVTSNEDKGSSQKQGRGDGELHRELRGRG